jgi:WD40 repeat protein
LLRHHGAVFAVTFAPGGRTLATGCQDGNVRIWEAATGRLLRTLHGHQGEVLAVAFAADGKLLASGGTDHTIRLWDPATGRQVRRLDGCRGDVTALTFASDGKTLASAVVGTTRHALPFFQFNDKFLG